MDVALTEQDIVLRRQLHLETLLGIEEDAVTELDLPHVGAGGDDGRPRQALAHGRCRWDEDAPSRPALALRLEGDEDPVVKHPDGQARGRRALGHRSVTAATHEARDDDEGDCSRHDGADALDAQVS